MDLDEFVEEALKQIVKGVSDAQAYAQDKDALINPRGLKWEATPQGREEHLLVHREVIDDFDLLIPQTVDFDIAVTISEGEKVRVAGGIFSGLANVGAQGNTEQANQTVSRIKFTLPIVLPRAHKRPK